MLKEITTHTHIFLLLDNLLQSEQNSLSGFLQAFFGHHLCHTYQTYFSLTVVWLI